MFRIRLITVGKQKPGPHQDLALEYLKHLKPYAVVDVHSVPEEKFRSKDDADRATKAEAERILKATPEESLLVVLEATGKTFSSEAFAQHLQHWSEQETRPLTFVIGGPLGIHASLKTEADILLSLSPMTMPHDLAHVVLLEQLFRAMTILHNKTYHY